ncbi:uncharacterized protein LOC121297662 [Polyodon spathula]|uniref:uncharacterized protein LOC121297662 n=1 Tax=Polyodon spathula TaxID=7913 RepID=UPI001B7EDAA9|nr:uncharacterized protein LOC121297662 [Polyodon spathula]
MANVDLAVYNLLETFYKHSGKEGVTLTLNQKTLTNLLQQELPSIVQDATLASTDTNRDGEVDFEEFITFRNENTTTKWDRYIRDLLTGKRWPNLFQPKNKLSNESDSECSSIRESKQDGFGRKVKKTLGKLLFLSHHQPHEKLKKCQDNTFNRPTTTKHAGIIGKKSFLPKSFKELPSPKLFTKMKPMVDENDYLNKYNTVKKDTRGTKTTDPKQFYKIEENEICTSFKAHPHPTGLILHKYIAHF